MVRIYVSRGLSSVFSMMADFISHIFSIVKPLSQSVANLKSAFDCGFDNYATVRSDPDLGDVHPTPEFEDLMNKYDKRFPNPLNIFKK